MLRVAILGAGGRMGRALIGAVAADEEIELAGALVRPGSALVGQDAGPAVTYTDQPVAALDTAAVAIDFSLPEAFMGNLAACREARCPAVIGTTGLSDVQHQRLRDVSHDLPVLWSPNMSVGVNLCFRLAALAASVLGEDYDVDIADIHHRHKRDAPSGTALEFGRLIADARGHRLEEIAAYPGTHQKRARHRGEIGFSVTRAGEIAGEHTVRFTAAGESVTLGHRAFGREAFADGALRAAQWLVSKSPGRYSMADVLGLADRRV